MPTVADLTADEFNAKYPVGTPVMAYPGVRPEDPLTIRVRQRQRDGHYVDPASVELCEGLTTVTRTPAWTLGHGEPVVSVEGYAGGICLTHIDVIEGGADRG
ncbi:hypothetical protein K701_25380 [Streptomyces fradiae ATCC 10745 = DSM 40063]|uniref:Uncharacterized protein n=1 Tax=Streptomyces fradiae ATCC 10745 = DSM 40063 TaxID=1319510 RepID=A0ABQ6XMY5_STRFR|nr:hypothetical protein K701_25380 [Streptomyces fradiae ATCC 10745 = DSM 40063]QEV12056.1 hypothetical protein CP974_08515 [Streptomyces fradiae ATCC 10745 = DSM 40063]